MQSINPAIILVEPQLPENIGLTARAMHNLGLAKLSIVNPRDGWPSKIAENSAKQGKNIIKKVSQNISKTKIVDKLITINKLLISFKHLTNKSILNSWG